MQRLLATLVSFPNRWFIWKDIMSFRHTQVSIVGSPQSVCHLTQFAICCFAIRASLPYELTLTWPNQPLKACFPFLAVRGMFDPPHLSQPTPPLNQLGSSELTHMANGVWQTGSYDAPTMANWHVASWYKAKDYVFPLIGKESWSK